MVLKSKNYDLEYWNCVPLVLKILCLNHILVLSHLIFGYFEYNLSLVVVKFFRYPMHGFFSPHFAKVSWMATMLVCWLQT